VFGRSVDEASDFHLFVVNPDGTQEKPLLAQRAECPHWSADASMLWICVSNPQGLLRVATIHADGSGLTLLDSSEPTLNLACAPWSADATRLVCEGWDDAHPDRGGLYTVRSSDGGDLQRITTNPFGAGDVPGSGSPDGNEIVFFRSKPDTNDSVALFTVHPDGTGLRQVTDYGVVNCCNAEWSPDGTRILFAAPSGALSTIHPDGSSQAPIALDIPNGFSYVFAPSWSPDGKSIVFSMTRVAHGNADIYTADADGKHVVQVTNTPEHEDFPDWGTLH
jgi:hypothetical protein